MGVALRGTFRYVTRVEEEEATNVAISFSEGREAVKALNPWQIAEGINHPLRRKQIKTLSHVTMVRKTTTASWFDPVTA